MNRFLLGVLAMISLCEASAFAAAPTISSFSPASSKLNTSVTLTGTNFVAPMTVSFNGVATPSVVVVNSTTATVTVPATASTGAITVATSGGSAMSASVFTVLPGAIASAAVGPPTTAVTVYYSGFSALEAVDVYFDNGDIGLGLTSANGAGNLAVTIPAAAHPGSHWISAVGRRSADPAQIGFTVRANWPQYGFAPNLKAKNRYENILSPATVADLDEAWRTPETALIETTPAVVNGIVYAGFNDGSIRAFDEITGASKWSYVTGDSVGSSPAVSNGIVYAGSDDQYLYALDAVTGALKWRYLTGAGNPPGDVSGVKSSPNVVNGIVYFGSNDDYVYALNATTGSLVWRFLTNGPLFSCSPLISNGVLYVTSTDDSVYALNAATGAKIWQFTAGSAFEASPVIAGGLVCAGNPDGNMYALYASTGAAAWTYPIAGAYSIDSSAASVGGAIFFGCDDGKVYSLSSGGALRWSTALPGGSIPSAPVCVANGVVYDTAEFGGGSQFYTYALDENSGAILTTLPVGSSTGGQVVVNGAVFACDEVDSVLARYTPNGLQSNYVAPRPDPMQLRPHPLR